jgi:hypothetical protein
MRYFIGFIVTVILIITLVVLLFNGGKKDVSKTNKPLIDYASTDAEVRMTIAGPIVYNTDHTEVRVIVDRNNVTYEQVKGYDGQVVDTKLFENTQNAYDAFLHALQHAGFTQGNNAAALRDDVGFCSTGSRYIFELNDGGDELQRYWASSCGGTKTYLGSLNLTLTLFQAQVPGYTELTSGLNLAN